MDAEIWKDIADYEGLYQVSSHGRIKRLASTVTRKHPSTGTIVKQPIAEKVLKLTPNSKSGYLCAGLSREGRVVRVAAHVVVAEEFVEFPENLKSEPKVYVCHNDGNPSNCHYKNLRYDTPKSNVGDRHRHGTHSVGEQNPSACYSEEDILNIKDLLRTMNSREISDLTGIPKSTIRGIGQGRAWGHVKSPYSNEVVFE